MKVLDYDPWAKIGKPESTLAKVAKVAKVGARRGYFSHFSHFSHPTGQDRCSRCLELEAQGLITLICSTCGYRADSKDSGPTGHE